MSWLEQHIEEFVRPQLEEQDFHCNDLKQALDPSTYFAQEELTVMKNAWRSIKREAKGQTILLPGRDVWCFEVLARRENYPTVFLPECSRMTVRYIAKTRPELKELFLFDTGFAGSIPRGLGTSENKFKLFSGANQLFPRLTLSRQFALKIEETPKYWESGRMSGGSFWQSGKTTITASSNKTTVVSNDTISVNPTVATVTYTPDTNAVKESEVQQWFSARDEFIRAARLTVVIYTNSAPKFIPRHKPLHKQEGG